tara:strand:+ start:1804 stop:2010 length:207 start_codon:yes stop_codon:yes gene_type:complete
MEFDALVAAEISNRITDQHEEAKGKRDAKSAVARRNQRRANRANDVGSASNLGQILSSTFNVSVGEED